MQKITDNTEEIQRNNKFLKGKSGNPSGRPKGSLNRATLAIKNMFENEIEEIGRKAIELAKNGDMQAIKMIIDRVIAPKKENNINFDFKKIDNGNDLIEAGNSFILAVSKGEINISEAKELFLILEFLRKNIEIEDLEKRLEKIENQQL